MREFVNREAMIAAAEMEVRKEARRHPGDVWQMQPGDTHEFATAVAHARKRLRNECLAERLDQVRKAATVRDDYEARGWSLPLWVRNTLDWAADPKKISDLYKLDDDGDVDLDNAIAALHRAIA